MIHSSSRLRIWETRNSFAYFTWKYFREIDWHIFCDQKWIYIYLLCTLWKSNDFTIYSRCLSCLLFKDNFVKTIWSEIYLIYNAIRYFHEIFKVIAIPFFLKNAQQHGKLEITEFNLIVKCTLYCAKTRIFILLEYFVKSNLAMNQSVSRNFKYIVRVTFLQSFAKYFVKSISHSFSE